MGGAADIVALPEVSDLEQIAALAQAVSRCAREHGLVEGSTLLWPNIETARPGCDRRHRQREFAGQGLPDRLVWSPLSGSSGERTASSSPRRCLRFLLECAAVGVAAVDCPYTWRDTAGLAADTGWVRRLGCKAKSAVAPEHATIINRLLTPTGAEVDRARRVRRVLGAFAAARAGLGSAHRALADRKPIADRAERLVARAKELGAIEEGG